MRKRTYHTPVNLLLEPTLYQHLRTSAIHEKVSMSQLIREGLKLRLDQIDKKNNAI